MRLHRIQIAVLGLLASARDPESDVAGSTPLNRDAARYSGDIDIFHDLQERVAAAAAADAAILQAAGYSITWLRQLPVIHSAEISKGGEATKLEWAVDSDFRFFPTVRDTLFGYMLHPIDLALNKVQAAAGRRELRDIVDLITINDTIAPLGALVWAVVEKSPGFTPEGLIEEIRRNLFHSAAEWRALDSEPPLEPTAVLQRVRAVLDDAQMFIRAMPTEKVGLLFLEHGKPVQPDPLHLDRYETHAGRRRGQWPSSVEISRAMFETYKATKPTE